MLILDHLALCCETLQEGQDYVEQALGIPLQPGGEHVHFGTHNLLLGLGPDLYFEVIAKNPDAPNTSRPTWFGLDAFEGSPRLGNWICSSTNYVGSLAAAPEEVGAPVSLSRDTIKWKLTVPDDGSLPFEGAYPSLIEWGQGVTPPPKMLPDQGVRLLKWEVHHPAADQISAKVDLQDDRIAWVVGPRGFRAEFETPNGIRMLT